MSVNIHDWTPDENPDHSRVMDALTEAGVDPDRIDLDPTGVWWVTPGKRLGDEIALGYEGPHDAELWTACEAATSDLVEYGYLDEVAETVARRCR